MQIWSNKHIYIGIVGSLRPRLKINFLSLSNEKIMKNNNKLVLNFKEWLNICWITILEFLFNLVLNANPLQVIFRYWIILRQAQKGQNTFMHINKKYKNISQACFVKASSYRQWKLKMYYYSCSAKWIKSKGY